MGETPEQLVQGRTEVYSFIGRRITDMTGTTATAGSVPYIDSNGSLAQSSAMNFDGSTRLTVTGIGSSTIVLGEVADPGAASENTATLYAVNVSGSTAIFARFGSGAAQQIAIEQ